MSKDITKFVSDKSREESMIDEFFRLAAQAKDKFELRELEQALLKPVPIPSYKGADTGRTGFKKRSLIMAFPDKSYIKRLSKYIRVNSYKDNNTWDVDLFVEVIRLMDKGKIKFDRETKHFKRKTKKGKWVTI